MMTDNYCVKREIVKRSVNNPILRNLRMKCYCGDCKSRFIKWRNPPPSSGTHIERNNIIKEWEHLTGIVANKMRKQRVLKTAKVEILTQLTDLLYQSL